MTETRRNVQAEAIGVPDRNRRKKKDVAGVPAKTALPAENWKKKKTTAGTNCLVLELPEFKAADVSV